jgi:hypothetical protein
MSRNIENIDRYLKGIELPEYESHQHRQQLRIEVLGKIERRQSMSVKVKNWKVAAVVALVCTGIAAAAVVGIKIYKYHYVDRDEEGHIRVLREDRRRMWVFSNKTANNPELAVQTAEEMDLLKQQDIKELVSVHEIEMNGQLDSRKLGYEYTLSDGRTIRQYEEDPDTQDLDSSLTEAQEDEIMSLLRADEYVTIGSEIKEVRGCMFTFKRDRFVLSDGTEVIKSSGRPIEDSQSVETTVDIDPKEADQILNDKREIANLRQQDKRELIAVDDLVANGELDGRVFVYRYQLSDGRTKDLREGDELNTIRNKKLRGDEVNFVLNKKQRQEWVQLKNTDSGENLGTYEQKFKDHLFVFKRQKFTLSDGTELIWSYGTLKDDQ